MNRALKIAIAVALVLLVAAVLISPAVDLAPTALRAALWVAALMASFALVRIAYPAVEAVHWNERGRKERRRILCLTSPPFFDLYGARLC